MLITHKMNMAYTRHVAADRRRDYFKDRAGARLLLLCIAACGLFWYGIFKLIF